MAKQKKSRRQIIFKRREREKKRKRTLTITLAIFAIGILGYLTINAANKPSAILVSKERMNLNPTKGSKNPIVILTEYGDFGCEACQAWHKAGIFTQILDRFEGQVQMEWRDFPIVMPPFSQKAAEAGQCAFDQNKFWEFHDITYERASYSALRDNDLSFYADKAGLDMDLFNQCFDSRKHKNTVEIDLSFARSLGFRGTPSFSVNDIPVIGANPDLLISIIESEISANQQ